MDVAAVGDEERLAARRAADDRPRRVDERNGERDERHDRRLRIDAVLGQRDGHGADDEAEEH